MNAAVLFYGVEQVTEAYEANGIAPWAIFCGKELMFANEDQNIHEGKVQLEATLKMIEKGGTTAAFLLRVYKLKPGEEITYKTDPIRGFPFKVFEREANAYVTRPRLEEENARFERIEAALEELIQARTQPTEEIGGIGAFLKPILELPEIRQAIAMKAVGFINNLFPMNTNRQQPAQVAGGDVPGQSLLNPDQVEKVQRAIHILCTKDAQLGDHLLKLAEIATNDPGKYAMALKFL